MSDQAIEILITNAIRTAFIKYPEGDGGPNIDYEWIAPDQSVHIAIDPSVSGGQRISDREEGQVTHRNNFPILFLNPRCGVEFCCIA